ncbi:hypothetical protein [Alkaliphilus sp. B6464]|uniref:hypothetical protein n=1 Tax=Alkaliphilus sp. B6464 TaxID=2731219 RepID=UPI001BAD49DD|nr:hypothetical protein [Alkaliphilus sp. B6464]QUH20136.1 hypothetical protein HYG84_09605 [Alkaliphilus sp. B6464]
MQEINVRIIPGEHDVEVLKAMAMADFIERQVAHLDLENKLQVYKSLLEDLERKDGNN